MRVMDRPTRRDRDERVPRTLAARPTLGRSLERERAHAPNPQVARLSLSLTPLPPSSLQPKFRPQPPPEAEYANYPANIMFDRRVVRGNTYAAHHSIREAQLERLS